MKVLKKILTGALCATLIGSVSAPIYADTTSQIEDNDGRLNIYKKFYINGIDTRANQYYLEINFKNVPDGKYTVDWVLLNNGKKENGIIEIDVKNGKAILPFAKVISRLDTLETGRYGDISFKIGNLPQNYEYEIKEIENDDFIASYINTPEKSDNVKIFDNVDRANYTPSHEVVTNGIGDTYIANTDKRASLSFTKKTNKETDDRYSFSLWALNNSTFKPALDVDMSHLTKLKTWDDIIKFYTTSYQEKYPDKTFSSKLDNWMPVIFPYIFEYFCSKADLDNNIDISKFSEELGEITVNSTLEDNIINFCGDETLLNLMPKIYDIYNYSSRNIGNYRFQKINDKKEVTEYEGENYKKDVTELLNYFKGKISAEEFIKLQLATIANVYDYRANYDEMPFFYNRHISQAASNDMIFGENGIVAYSQFDLGKDETKTVYIVSEHTSEISSREAGYIKLEDFDTPPRSKDGSDDNIDIFTEECLLDAPYTAHFLLLEKSGNDYTSDTPYLYDYFEYEKIENNKGNAFLYQLPKDVIITNLYEQEEETTTSEEETTTVEEETTTSEEETTTSEENITVSEEKTTTSEEETIATKEDITTSLEEQTTIIDNETTYSEQESIIEENITIQEDDNNDYEITSEVQSVENPETGDKNQLPVWITLVTSSIAILITGLIQRKRKKN